jgi:hypothetical protein
MTIVLKLHRPPLYSFEKTPVRLEKSMSSLLNVCIEHVTYVTETSLRSPPPQSQQTSDHHPLFFFSSSSNLLISQQRCPLLILTHDGAPRNQVPAQQAWHANSERQHKQQPTDRKRKDPLELEQVRFRQKLAHARCYILVSRPSLVDNGDGQ